MKDWFSALLKNAAALLVACVFAAVLVYGLTSQNTRSLSVSKPVATVLAALAFAHFLAPTNRR